MRARLPMGIIALVVMSTLTARSSAVEFEVGDASSPPNSFEISDSSDPHPRRGYAIGSNTSANSPAPSGSPAPPSAYSGNELDFGTPAWTDAFQSDAGRDLTDYPADNFGYGGGYEDSYGGGYEDGYYAGGCGDCGGGCDSSCRGGCRRPGWFLDAWVAQGFTWNPQDPASGFNTPLTFNDFSNDYQMNQLYATFGRAVNECGRCWDIGGRIDLLYGTDYFFTTADGLETRQDGVPHWNSGNGPRVARGFTFARYGLALPQAYGEVFAPFLSGLKVKLGHFYSPLGYESVRAPENFFYSHSFTWQYGLPRTFSGALADLAVGKVNFQFGWTQGWNTWDNANGAPGYLAGFTWCPNRCSSLAFGLTTGREDPTGFNDRTAYSLVYTRKLIGGVTYVFENVLGTQSLAAVDEQFNLTSAKWYGFNNYFFFEINPMLTFGIRAEWFRDQDNFRVLGIPLASSVNGGNYASVSLGANWRPKCNLIVRPEIRFDRSDVSRPAWVSKGRSTISLKTTSLPVPSISSTDFRTTRNRTAVSAGLPWC